MRILVDMNLSPEWIGVLRAAGIDAVHWSSVGARSAEDAVLFQYARDMCLVLLTQDLDFSQLLFETRCSGSSTVLLRIKDDLDDIVRGRVTSAIRQHLHDLETGALLVISADRIRIRSLPLRPQSRATSP
jgi:predicted nuclease of predicted toxin-antitoxin system